MEAASQVIEARSEDENLLLRRTPGDLLEKLRQLQQWRQQKEEHLLQDKQKQISVLRDKERRLHAVQEYQRKILQNNSLSNGTLTLGSAHGSPLFQDKLSISEEDSQTMPNPNENMVSGSTTAVSGSNLPTRNVLLSPQHFKASKMDSSYVSPVFIKPQNPMLLTQKVQIPTGRDEELSQFTESDGASVGDIEGVRPFEDTASEASLDDEDDFNSEPLDSADDDEGAKNETLVHENSEAESENEEKNNYVDSDDEEDNDDEILQQTVQSAPLRDINSTPSFDEIPIKPGLGAQTKTFEELLSQQLQAEQQIEKREERRRAVKRSFLKKGEGIARFGLKPKTVTRQDPTTTAKVKGNNALEHKAPIIENNPPEQRAPVTRKTATVKQTSNISRRGLHPGSLADQEKKPISPKKVKFGPSQSAARVIGPFEFTDDLQRSESDSEEGGLQVAGNLAAGNEAVVQDSFQERMRNWDELEVVEKQELNEFELLEEAAAANCSLSSNSSTVIRILGNKRKHHTADVNNNMLGAGQDWRLAVRRREIVEVDSEGNRTLTEEKFDEDEEDDGNVDDTLKNPEVISVHSSLALSDGFDDSKTWEDHDALDVSNVTDDVMLMLNTSTPDEKSQRRSSQAQQRKLVSSHSTPPTSALVTKLFPQLKAKNEASKSQAKRKETTPQELRPSHAVTNDPVVTQDAVDSSSADGGTDDGMSRAVREKLQELEKEIEKFREENVALHRLREEREKDLEELRKERSAFEIYKTEELERLEKFKTEEERRLRRDKRVFEQYQKASRVLPDKKERDEITQLKAQISELQEDLKLRESRWSAAATRYKDRISKLEKENREMKEEVKLLEKQNLELQRREQQKNRELQQRKAFEKKKLKQTDAIQTSSVPEINEVNNENGFDEEERLKTAPSEMKTHLVQPVSDSVSLHTSSDDSPPGRIAKNRPSVSVRKQEINMKVDAKESVENASSVPPRLQEHSPPTKQVGSSKSVRFRDDLEEEGKQMESLTKQLCHSDGKREKINSDGSRVVTFANGTRKEISADGLSVVVTFFNGDVKQIFPDGRVEYYYAEVQTTHTTYPDGLEVLRFPSNQIEKHYPDGTKEIIFPDQTVKYLYTSGAEECVFTDGTVERISVDGERIVEFPNGQRETYTKLYKKREYPDGTVKTVYSDGRQETRYASGRLRVKDSEGRLLVDTAEHNVQAQKSVTS